MPSTENLQPQSEVAQVIQAATPILTRRRGPGKSTIWSRMSAALGAKNWLDVAVQTTALNGHQQAQQQRLRSMEREEEAAARAMGWPEMSKGKADDEMITNYIGENISVGNQKSNGLKSALLTAGLTALGVGGLGLGVAWLAGMFDKDKPDVPVVQPADPVTNDYRIETQLIPPGQ